MSVGCKKSCDAQPCYNEAVCEERWTDYKCHCSNKYAHFGQRCEKGTNKYLQLILHVFKEIQKYLRSRTSIFFSFKMLQTVAFSLTSEELI